MRSLVSDAIFNEVVVGERHAIAGTLHARVDDVADSVSIRHNRCPDPNH